MTRWRTFNLRSTELVCFFCFYILYFSWNSLNGLITSYSSGPRFWQTRGLTVALLWEEMMCTHSSALGAHLPQTPSNTLDQGGGVMSLSPPATLQHPTGPQGAEEDGFTGNVVRQALSQTRIQDTHAHRVCKELSRLGGAAWTVAWCPVTSWRSFLSLVISPQHLWAEAANGRHHIEWEGSMRYHEISRYLILPS